MPVFPLRTSQSGHGSHYSPYSPSRFVFNIAPVWAARLNTEYFLRDNCSSSRSKHQEDYVFEKRSRRCCKCSIKNFKYFFQTDENNRAEEEQFNPLFNISNENFSFLLENRISRHRFSCWPLKSFLGRSLTTARLEDLSMAPRLSGWRGFSKARTTMSMLHGRYEKASCCCWQLHVLPDPLSSSRKQNFSSLRWAWKWKVYWVGISRQLLAIIALESVFAVVSGAPPTILFTT